MSEGFEILNPSGVLKIEDRKLKIDNLNIIYRLSFIKGAHHENKTLSLPCPP